MPVLKGLDTTMELTRRAQALKAQRYDIIQLLPARILGADGIVLDIDPDATHPDRDDGLFSV